jgi:hypothetical protein
MLWQAVVAAGEASTRLVVLPGFLIISLHDLLHAIDDGFRCKVLCFFLLRLLIVRSTLSGVIFHLDFDPFFFLLLFPWRVFFLYLII